MRDEQPCTAAQDWTVNRRGTYHIFGPGYTNSPQEETSMSSHLPGDAPPPQTTHYEIEALAAQFLAQLQSGEKADRTIAAQTLERLTEVSCMAAGDESAPSRGPTAIEAQTPRRLGRYEVFE